MEYCRVMPQYLVGGIRILRQESQTPGPESNSGILTYDITFWRVDFGKSKSRLHAAELFFLNRWKKCLSEEIGIWGISKA
jgi:hypothetical protein